MKYALSKAIFITTLLLAPLCPAEEFDIVILNGRVMDPETKFDEIANVGINNGWITEITTEDIEGRANGQ